MIHIVYPRPSICERAFTSVEIALVLIVISLFLIGLLRQLWTRV